MASKAGKDSKVATGELPAAGNSLTTFSTAAIVGMLSSLLLMVSRCRSISSEEIAGSKPFATFDDFYPFYLSQHEDITCRRLHFVGTSIMFAMAVVEPRIFSSLLLSALLGFAVFHCTRHLESGLVEMVAMMGTFIFLMKVTTGSWAKGIMPPVVAYTCAWVGHFFFELNRPATFIYPVFSLMGDFKLWLEIFTQQRPF